MKILVEYNSEEMKQKKRNNQKLILVRKKQSALLIEVNKTFVNRYVI